MHERTISAGVVWCMYCTCNTVQGLGRASPSPAQSFVGLSANITFPRAFNNIVSLFDVADSVFFRDLLKNTKHTWKMFTYEVVQQCALHCGYSPFNNARFLVYLYCIGFRQRHRLYNCFTSYFNRVFYSLITRMLLSKHSFCAFSPQRTLYVLVCILFLLC